MQLNKKLGLAVASLLVSTQGHADDWLVDSGMLLYSETDSEGQDRVSVVEPVVIATKEYDTNDFFRYTVVFDALTGASPNGAPALTVSQEFPGFVVAAGETPLDNGFEDQRLAMGVVRGKPFDHGASRYEMGANFSVERDYLSLGSSLLVAKDSADKQTTVSGSLGLSFDVISPRGGLRPEFGSIFDTVTAPSGRFTLKDDDDDEDEDGYEDDDDFLEGEKKLTLEGLIGISHVLNQYTVLSANYGLSLSNGYLSDPYKVVALLDTNGRAEDYLWEKRPDKRVRQTLAGKMVTALGEHSLHLSYRYFRDDWGIASHTGDMEFYLRAGDKWQLRPHLRYSRQSAADFYVPYLAASDDLPTYASSDYRLGGLTTATAGMKIIYHLPDDRRISLNLEQVKQNPDSWDGLTLNSEWIAEGPPSVTFYAITIGYRTKW